MPPPRGTNPIVQDVLYFILEHVGDSEVRTIRSCTLVSQEWLHVARRYLFTSIVVDETAPGHDLPSFLKFLGNQPLRIHSCVLSLKIFGGRRTPFDILDVVAKLSRLRNLQVHLELLPLPSAPKQPCAYEEALSFPPLDSLFFNTCAVDSAEDQKGLCHPLIYLITRFSSIDRLGLESLLIRQASIPAITAAPPLTPLPQARVGMLVYNPRFDLLLGDLIYRVLTHLDLTHLHTLHADPWPELGSWLTLQTVLNSIPRLKHLALRFSPIPTLFPAEPLTTLVCCSYLESIVFTIPCHLMDYDTDEERLYQFFFRFGDMLDMLASLSLSTPQPHPLSLIRVELLLSTEDEPPDAGIVMVADSIDFTRIDVALMAFSNLREVEIEFRTPAEVLGRRPIVESDDNTFSDSLDTSETALDTIRDQFSCLPRECKLSVWESSTLNH